MDSLLAVLRMDLEGLIERMQLLAQMPEYRSREFSLAVTNVEQGLLWLNAVGGADE
jgi:hypothetical protein